MKTFNLSDIDLTKYLFFTGKGGVGKTSIACATAVGLADNGKKILLISTDPASNLQDVFNQTLNGHGTDIQEVPGLTVVNLDPEQAAAEYRESVIAPFYNPQIQISAESETKRSIFREKDKTKRSKKESAQHSKSRNKSFVMTSVSAL